MTDHRQQVYEGYGVSSTHNPNCEGSHCTTDTGEVRSYTLGEGETTYYGRWYTPNRARSEYILLCRSCWVQENQYRWTHGHGIKNWFKRDEEK